MSPALLIYEAFLPHHTPSKHRVMAITHTVDTGHTELHALATLPDALTATRLADALNSRLLARRNHTDRLTSALHGLPDSIHAAIHQLPIDPDRAGPGHTPMAAHIHTDPIDGLLLFPTTGCPPEGCPDCTDYCANGCDTCPTCTADDPLDPCELCLPPDLTPRTAHALAFAGHVLADGCYDVVTEAWADRGDLPLPPYMTNQSDDFIRRMARCFDDLVADLHDGEPPALHNLAEQLALHLMIDRAEEFHTDQPELLDALRLLPTSPHDYDFDTLFEVLFEDHDHIGYLDHPHAPGTTLDDLFDPFQPDHDRDPDRGFRR